MRALELGYVRLGADVGTLSCRDDEDDEEDDAAELMRELEKIKRERAEEKARQEREQSEKSAAAREAEIATANPLLNLAAALGQNPNGVNTTVPGTFAVKRRWDDGEPASHLMLVRGRGRADDEPGRQT